MRFRSTFAFSSLALIAAVFVWACGDDATPSTPQIDAGFGVDSSSPGTQDSSTSTPADSSTTTDAGTDSSPPIDPTAPVTCKSLHALNPAAPSGMFTIDLDGNGTAFEPMSAYCDMSFDGGGWTMIQSFVDGKSASNLAGGPDAGFGLLIASPEPGKLGGFTGQAVQKLAEVSAQVHIRLSFQSAAGADAGTWVTSRAANAEDGGATRVITNLRNLDVLTKDTDGGYEDWGGPFATALKLAWVPQYGGGPGTCLNPVQITKYPSIYWACGNFSSMNLYAPQSLARWTYSPATANEPMEVLVR